MENGLCSVMLATHFFVPLISLTNADFNSSPLRKSAKSAGKYRYRLLQKYTRIGTK
jgi:antibiotic biosynthesis monooxygenase (ABM) superfamily enzyme